MLEAPVVREPCPGACRNCGWRRRVTIAHADRDLCVQELVTDGGEIYECDPAESECDYWIWDWDGSDL